MGVWGSLLQVASGDQPRAELCKTNKMCPRHWDLLSKLVAIVFASLDDRAAAVNGGVVVVSGHPDQSCHVFVQRTLIETVLVSDG